ncbi:NAD(P)-dependent oxidoreductase [Actinomycetota bacterium]
MPPSQTSTPGNPGLLVTIVDPLTWSRDFSYEVESSILGAAGVTLLVPEDSAERDRLLPQADAIISTGIEPVDAATIKSLERCVAIQCYSVGMNAVDIEAATAAGMRVANVNVSTADVADHTMALLLSLERRLVAMFEATERHEWDLRKLSDPWEIRRLEGRTLGIVGAGRIGRSVAVRARAFGYETIAHDLVDPADPELEMVSLNELFARSDAIAICASLDPTAPKLIDTEVLAHTKPGALFVNAARGGLIDEAALESALEDGRIRLAALDVRDPEPPDAENDSLGARPDVVQTPHMAAISERTRSDIHIHVAESILTMLRASGRLTDDTAGNR